MKWLFLCVSYHIGQGFHGILHPDVQYERERCHGGTTIGKATRLINVAMRRSLHDDVREVSALHIEWHRKTREDFVSGVKSVSGRGRDEFLFVWSLCRHESCMRRRSGGNPLRFSRRNPVSASCSEVFFGFQCFNVSLGKSRYFLGSQMLKKRISDFSRARDTSQ